MVPARFTHPLDLNYHPPTPKLPSSYRHSPFSYYFPFIFGFSIIPIYANFSAFNSRHIFFHLFYLFLGNLLTHPDTPANSWKRLKLSSCFCYSSKIFSFTLCRLTVQSYGRLMPRRPACSADADRTSFVIC